jgi:nucleotide-binding universal stress UspA family protein
MYDTILLAYDGSLEGRTALREGALLAKACGAKVFLLSVVAVTPGMWVAEGAYAGCLSRAIEKNDDVFAGGMARLRELGLEPRGRIVAGEPAQEIAACARQIRADLVIVGHRRQTLLERWWSGSAGAYLVDHIGCSLLIARNPVSEEAMRAGG